MFVTSITITERLVSIFFSLPMKEFISSPVKMSNLCKNCNGTSIVRDALGNKFFCPKCHIQ